MQRNTAMIDAISYCAVLTPHGASYVSHDMAHLSCTKMGLPPYIFCDSSCDTPQCHLLQHFSTRLHPDEHICTYVPQHSDQVEGHTYNIVDSCNSTAQEDRATVCHPVLLSCGVTTIHEQVCTSSRTLSDL